MHLDDVKLMKTLYFEVTLLTDIILNQKAATEGPNTTLDFIPGSNFLGIVASRLYNDQISCSESLDLFHNGSVRFGDAHPASQHGARTLKVPAVMFYPKLSSADKELFISTLASSDEMRGKQLKQCRSGFYDFTSADKVAEPSVIDTTFAIKSAHDRQTRTSMDEKMYGYESLQAGAHLYFSVEVDNESLCSKIAEALTQGASKRVGRSRSAQYGLVEIKQLSTPYTEAESHSTADGTQVAVYADSRLVFIDENTGLPTLQPTAGQLGFQGGTINWCKSQVRSFQYAPWNFKRQCFDTDRFGIEKGSVIIIDDAKGCPQHSQYVGSYRCEGFGRVIYNPDFVSGNPQTAESDWKLKKNEAENAKNGASQSDQAVQILTTDSALLAHIKAQHNAELEEQRIFNLVNKWIHGNNDQNWRRFNTKRFASQWGTIRSIATRRLMDGGRGSGFKSIEEELLKKDDKKECCGYLRHGVAEHSWEEFGRLAAFKSFIEEDLDGMAEDKRCLAIINLASEMAKLYRKENIR